MDSTKDKRLAQALPPYLALLHRADGPRYHADWTDAAHHHRRFASEFIGTFGFVFTLAGGAAIFHAYAHPAMSPGMTLALMTSVSALWLVVAIHALGDVSAHFNPAVTLAFAMRGDMSWKRAGLTCSFNVRPEQQRRCWRVTSLVDRVYSRSVIPSPGRLGRM